MNLSFLLVRAHNLSLNFITSIETSPKHLIFITNSFLPPTSLSPCHPKPSGTLPTSEIVVAFHLGSQK